MIHQMERNLISDWNRTKTDWSVRNEADTVDWNMVRELIPKKGLPFSWITCPEIKHLKTDWVKINA